MILFAAFVNPRENARNAVSYDADNDDDEVVTCGEAVVSSSHLFDLMAEVLLYKLSNWFQSSC